MITGSTQILGVMGCPIEHSLSPVMHNAAIEVMRSVDADALSPLNYVYLPFSVKPERLAAAIAGFSAIGVQGFNVTIPHKQAIIPFLSEVSAIAQAVGAVNTVYPTATGWGGTNTDVIGFLAPLRAMGHDWSQTQAVILGNGGAARAVVAGCAELGVGQIQVVGRNPEARQAFLQSWAASALAERLDSTLSVHGWEELPLLLPTATLLVNTTPVGMHPQVGASPVSLDLLQQLPTGAIAYDLIYTPRPTQFLRDAASVGAIALDGLEMLVQQGAAALELWLKRPVPIAVMRQALEDALSR
ncbi:MAG TPA: shikimate dehydrogenase [Chroococcidiopsis sp.]